MQGWDNLRDDLDNNGSMLGGLTWTISDDTTLAASLITGNEGVGRNQTAYSLVLTHKLCDRLSYVLQHDLGVAQGEGPRAEWASINQYLLYDWTDDFSTGIRAEWFRDADGARVIGLRSGAGGMPSEYTAVSLGAKYKLSSLVTIRAETRWDIQNRLSGENFTYSQGRDDNQFVTAVNAIISF